MGEKQSQVIRNRSNINYSYATIKITKSRIEKGLIAIPVSLTNLFPEENATIQVCVDDSLKYDLKKYSSYKSTTRECRIGGMVEWLKENEIKSGDEIVIQLIDKEQLKYRIIPEKKFIGRVQKLQKSLDGSQDEEEVSKTISDISKWIYTDKGAVVLREFNRLTSQPFEKRKHVSRSSIQHRESVPSTIRFLLSKTYNGHCQVCDFWFLKKDGNPYFEIHHLNPLFGHHPKNLILACANCHRQFEYAHVKHIFDNKGFLSKVSFNTKKYSVNQIFHQSELFESFKQLFI